VRSRAVVPWSLFALLLAAYLLAYSGDVQSSDELSMLCVTRSLATRGMADTDAIHWMGLQQGAFGPDGHLYSKYGLGTSLAAVPLLAVARLSPVSLGTVQTTWLLNAILTALTGVLVFLTVARLGYGEGIALATAILYGLGTTAAVYSQSFFSEPLSALSLLAVGYFVLRFRDGRRSMDVALAGVALGVALLARVSNVVVAPVFGLHLLALCWPDWPFQLRQWWAGIWRPALAFAIPLALGALTVAAYNVLRYGDPLQTGYHPLETFSTPFLTGLVGLLFSPGKSVFLYSPILLLVVAAFPTFFHRHRAEALLVGGVFVAHVLLYAPWFVWHGGHCWGPRFLVPALPFLVLALAPALAWAARSPWRIALVGALALVSGAVQALGLAVSFDRFFETMDVFGFPLYDPRLFFDPAYSPLVWQARFVLAGGVFPAWARDAGALLPPLVLLALALGAPALARRRGGWLMSLVLAGACVLAPLMLVARLYPDPHSLRSPRPAYQDLTRTIDGLARPNDGVVLNAPARTTVLLEYLRAPVPILGLHEPGAPSAEAQAALAQYAATCRRLWLVSDETAPAAGLDRWLAARGYQALAAGFGPAGLTLYAFPMEPPILRALNVTLGHRITLLSVGAAASAAPGDVLPVAVTWRPAEAWHTPEQLHLVVQLLRPGGSPLAQQDWVLVQEEETTSRMGLLIPVDAASGTYRLEARAYRPQDGRWFTTPAGEEAVVLGDVTIAGP